MASIFTLPKAFEQRGIRFNVARQETDGSNVSIDIIEVDATLSENHSSTIEPTDSTIETGAIITDHFNVSPKQITIEGIVSNDPIRTREALIGNAAGLVGGIIGRSAENSLFGAIGTGALAAFSNSIAKTLTNEKNRAKMAMEKLQAAQEAGAIISVQTALRQYTNMIIQAFSVNRNAQTGNVLRFTMTLREIRTVRSLVETIISKDAIKQDTQSKATPETDNGRQTAEETTTEKAAKAQDAKNNSYLLQITGN